MGQQGKRVWRKNCRSTKSSAGRDEGGGGEGGLRRKETIENRLRGLEVTALLLE